MAELNVVAPPPKVASGTTREDTAIRPFQAQVSDEALAELFAAELRAAFKSLR